MGGLLNMTIKHHPGSLLAQMRTIAIRGKFRTTEASDWREGVVIFFTIVFLTLASGFPSLTASAIIEHGTDSSVDGTNLGAVHPIWINATCVNISNSQTIEIDGVNQTTPVIMYWEGGSEHTLRVYVDSNPTGCSYCKFNSWEDGSKSLVRTIVVTGPLSVLAQFDDYYEIGVMSYPHSESLGVGFSFWDGDIIIPYGPNVIFGYVRKGMKGVYTSSPQIGALSLSHYFFDYWYIERVGIITDIGASFDMVTCTWAMAYFSSGSLITVDIITNVGPLLVSYDSNPFYRAPVSFPGIQGSTHVLRTTSPQEHDGTRYIFVDWLGGPTTLNWTVTFPNEEYRLYIANFVPKMRYVTIQEGLSCGGQLSHLSGWYLDGAVMNITWTPPGSPPLAENDTLFRWRGTGNGSYSGRGFVARVTVNGPIVETAECLCIRSNNTDIISDEERIEARNSIHRPAFMAECEGIDNRIRVAARCEPLCPPRLSR